MPRYTDDKEFRLGDFWLGKRSGSPAWHRCWFDADTRQTRRASLGTIDFDEAKEQLTDWFIINQNQTETAPDEILIADVLANYWHGHGQHIASNNTARIPAFALDVIQNIQGRFRRETKPILRHRPPPWL